jgi:nitroreductase
MYRQGLGLDTILWTGYKQHVAGSLRQPENYWIPCLLAVGYFDRARTLPPPKWRKSYEEIVVSFGK